MDDESPAFPAGWHARLHARNGGPVPPDTAVDEALARDVLERVAGLSDRLKEYIDADMIFADGLGRHARAYLDGAADPLGAAATAVALSHDAEFGTRFHGPGGPRHETRYDGLADAWTSRHGLAFAAAAFVELSGLEPEREYRDGRGTTSGVRLARDEDPMHLWWHARRGGVRRMRELAAAADAPVVERLGALRTAPVRRIVASYLIPDRADWLEECCAAPPGTERERNAHWMLWCSLGSADQLRRFRGVLHLEPDDLMPDVLATVLERVGPAALAPVLGAELDRGPLARSRDAMLGLLAAVPSDEAFRVLAERAGNGHVRRALDRAARRFPERARRLLPPAPAPVPRTLPDAPPDALPPLLVRPPWERAGDPAPVPGLRAPAGRRVVWEPGERKRWAADAAKYPPKDLGRGSADGEPADAIEAVRAGNPRNHRQEITAFLHAPEGALDDVLPGWTPKTFDTGPAWIRPLVARYESRAREHALRVAAANREGARAALVPFLDAEVAALMARWWALRAGPLRPVRAWFARHGLDAVPLLVPAALGGPGEPRRFAEHALRSIAGRTDAGRVAEAARVHGDAAADAVRRLLADEPVPVRVPALPDWARPDALPQVRVRDRAAALPAEATARLAAMLAVEDPDLPGAAAVREACDPASLAAFGRALCEAWLEHGGPPAHYWALRSLGTTGDDDTVRRLVPLIRRWPTEHMHHRAAMAIDVLAEIGTPVALLHLYDLARTARHPAVEQRTRSRFGRAAKRAGVPADRLAERIVPGFGLDADGALTADYGPRRFRIGFDERLRPFVEDRDGRRRAALPAPGARDDAERAAAARRRFTAIKAEVRAASKYLAEALENAMAHRYGWTPDEFRALFADHPIARHVARRLVWTAGGTAFRIAEDGTLADVRDDAFVPPADGTVRVADPADLGGDLAAWRETFDDYEIVQPFAQLAGAPVP
ncbi:DUF4132 domain-containing protein [Spirillospora sp. NPDC052242]